MSKAFIILSMFLLGSVLSQGSIGFQLCPSKGSIRVVKHWLSQSEIDPGNWLDLFVSLEAAKSVTFDTLTIVAKINGVVALDNAQPVGPITLAAGKLTNLVYPAYIPNFIPSGNYSVDLRLTNSKKPSVILGCAELSWSVPS